MRIINFILIICALIMSCNSSQEKQQETESSELNFKDSLPVEKNKINKAEDEIVINLDSIKQVILKQKTIHIDTTSYIFSLEGDFSAEGNEGRAFYKNNKIDKVEITFYGEMGKSVYAYYFKGDKINVFQQRYNYKVYFSEIKSDADIQKAKGIRYITDLDGKIIEPSNSDADLDIFHELKKAVPFDLN